VVEKAPPARTSMPVPSLRKDEDPGVAPMVNLASVPPVDATSMVVRTRLTRKRSSPRMKSTRKLLPMKMTTTLSPWVVGPRQGSEGSLGVLPLALTLMLA
jgi:hypothetical protein